MKLNFKLVIIPILSIILTFMIILVFSVNKAQHTTQEALEKNQETIVKSVTTSVDAYLTKYIDAIHVLSSFDEVKNIDEHKNIDIKYRGLSNNEGLALRKLFKNNLITYKEFAYLETFTKDKAINVVLEPYEAQLNISEENYLKGFSYRDWYKGAMSTESIYLSEAYISASIMEPVVAISTPIFNDLNEINSIMIGALKLRELSSMVKELSYGETGITYIIDKNGNMVAHPDSNFFESNTLFSIENNKIVKYIFNHNDNNYKTIRLYDNITNADVYVNYSFITETEWVVISQISASEADAPLTNTVQLVLAVTSILMVLLVVFFYLNTQQVVNSMLFLSNISKKLTGDQLSVTPETAKQFQKYSSSHNEIGTLSSSYYEMLNTLNDNFNEIEQSKAYIEHLANHDPLTNIANRRYFRNYLLKSLEASEQGIVIMLDLDNFKTINDTMGHVFGDQVLIQISERLSSLVEDNIFVSRFGGDEFIICINNISLEDYVNTLVDRIKETIEKPMSVNGVPVNIQFSFGISRYPADTIDLSQLIKYADLALYAVKKEGKNSYKYFDQTMEHILVSQKAIEEEIKFALTNNGFKMVYQPQVNIKNGEIIAYESLIRMKNFKFNPDQFIKIAEDNGDIIQIGRFVVKEVIEQLSIWKSEGKDIKPVSINYSAVQLQDTTFIDYLEATLTTKDIDPSLIELEITENIFIDNLEKATTFLNAIKSLGVKSSIDDFGTGYSSLNYLTALPIHKLKLDRELSERFLYNDNVKVIKHIIGLCHSLDLIVVAEGIENKAGITKLIEADCDIVQGYYFSRPMDVCDVYNPENLNYEDKI